VFRETSRLERSLCSRIYQLLNERLIVMVHRRLKVRIGAVDGGGQISRSREVLAPPTEAALEDGSFTPILTPATCE